MKPYTVEYKSNVDGIQRKIVVLANSKYDAYDKATYEEIPKLEGCLPYSSWVRSVTYNNGNVHYFNTCEGLAY